MCLEVRVFAISLTIFDMYILLSNNILDAWYPIEVNK